MRYWGDTVGSTLRRIEFEGRELYVCPNGCEESELELGKDESSFMAMMGVPYKYIRCGECGFGDGNKGSNVKLDMQDVITVWNETCEVAVTA